MTKAGQNGPPDDGAGKIKKHVGRILPKRFYDKVTVEAEDDHFVILLDARAVHTPQQDKVILPTRPLADAVADEWRQQEKHVDPHTMPLTKLCNSVLDGVIPRRNDVIADIAKYAGHDAICYRAQSTDGLCERQSEAWDPILDWAHSKFKVKWTTTAGVMPITQPTSCVGAIEEALREVNSFQLAAVHELATITGSTLLAMAYRYGVLEFDGLWRAAHIDEDFQIERWGEDAEAQQRRQKRLAEAHAADRLFCLSVV